MKKFERRMELINEVAALCKENDVDTSKDDVLNETVVNFISSAQPSQQDKLLMLSHFAEWIKALD